MTWSRGVFCANASYDPSGPNPCARVCRHFILSLVYFAVGNLILEDTQATKAAKVPLNYIAATYPFVCIGQDLH